MASLQTRLRQPFGVLDSGKLRNLQSIKNRQNGIAPALAQSLKRRHIASDPSDSENVEPTMLEASAAKRKRTDDSDDLCKPAKMRLITFPTPKPRLSNLSGLTTRPETPSVNSISKTTNAPSAPTTVSRSSNNLKRPGILSGRRTRLNAPAFGGRGHAPLSFAAAVNGTLANVKKRRVEAAATLESSTPKSWFFDIYEEPEEQQIKTIVHVSCMNGLMEEAIGLDLSDDEKAKTAKTEKELDEDKENIPPHNFNIAQPARGPTARARTRVSSLTDEPRTPLGNLNPSDYYAKHCDATSVVLVAEDVAEPAERPPHHVDDSIRASSILDYNFHVEASGTDKQDKLMTNIELANVLLNAAPVAQEQSDVEQSLLEKPNDADAENAEPADIEIWESGSAQDEAGEMEVSESIFAAL